MLDPIGQTSTCAPLVLSVHDTPDAAVGEAHFADQQAGLDAEEIEGLLGLGLRRSLTGDGVVGFLRDGKTLEVDATALPDGLGPTAPAPRTRSRMRWRPRCSPAGSTTQAGLRRERRRVAG